MAKTRSGSISSWPENACAWYSQFLERLSDQDFVPPDMLQCIGQTAKDPDTPKRTAIRCKKFLKNFNPETGERTTAPEPNDKKRNKTRRRPGRRRGRR